jgi:hypothetical protein
MIVLLPASEIFILPVQVMMCRNSYILPPCNLLVLPSSAKREKYFKNECPLHPLACNKHEYLANVYVCLEKIAAPHNLTACPVPAAL